MSRWRDLADGDALYRLAADLFPLCRSITGPGIRETLARLAEYLPLDLVEVPSGTKVLDWTVPNEWTIRDGYILDPKGSRVVDFHRSNLHVVSYSTPVALDLTLAELRPRLHTIPERPDWTPYRTSYYQETWGFCLSQRQLDGLPEGRYRAVIDADLRPGGLVFGECVLPGREPGEVLLSTHCCHPSLANDNLSGVVVAAGLAKWLAGRDRRLTYRILFVPGTIGALAWLDRNRLAGERVTAGLVLSCLGDRGSLSFKQSRRGDTVTDRAIAHLFGTGGIGTVRPFAPTGYDERQYCSPGFNLPVGALTRTRNGQYPEYHTSADDLALIDPTSLGDSLSFLQAFVDLLDGNVRFRSQEQFGEPQLGRRGLFRSGGGRVEAAHLEEAMLWVLNMSDGGADLLAIADRSGIPYPQVVAAAMALREAGLLV